MEALSPKFTRLLHLAVIAAAYFFAGKIGLHFTVYPSSTPVWPCSGIAVAALLILGYDVWPGVFVGALLINLSITGNPLSSAAIAVGNTFEGVACAWLMNHYGNGARATQRSQNIFKLALFSLLCAAIAATVGVRSLVWTGGLSASPAAYNPVWATWWLGDTIGMIVVAPLLLTWKTSPPFPWNIKTVFEVGTLALFLVAITLTVFDNAFIPTPSHYPLEYLCVPFLIWAALRFGPREASISILVLSAIALWGTWNEHGPFAAVQSTGTVNIKVGAMFQLQTFLGVATIMTLVLAAEVAERRRSETDARLMSMSDRLTGLGNYRKLIDTLESEIVRSERVKRPFVFVLMDLDRLKQINDIYGHAAGNRALCRVSNVLRVHCRSIDTPARFGGDEFALLLPESGIEFGHRIADRIRMRLARDGEFPALSVSIGFSVWREGVNAETLIQEADRALYAMKHGNRRSVSIANS